MKEALEKAQGSLELAYRDLDDTIENYVSTLSEEERARLEVDWLVTARSKIRGAQRAIGIVQEYMEE